MNATPRNETTKPSGSNAPTCWADLTPDQRNTLIGERLGAKPMNNIWLVWQPMKPDGSILCKKHIGQLGDMPMAEAEKWLADSKKSKAEWTRRNINLDWLLREDVSLFEQRWHSNYTTTPGGGWMVIEALRKAGHAVQIASTGKGWKVAAHLGCDAVCIRAETMEDAACQLYLQILPNASGDARRPSAPLA